MTMNHSQPPIIKPLPSLPFLSPAKAKEALIQLLQLAYSGELAAANAYRGHWQSVKGQHEKDEIFQIEIEELQHRKLVGEMLKELGAKPNRWREFKMNLIGKAIGILCHFGGWFIPMYGAGKLESHNIKEYEDAARYALMAGYEHFIETLLELAEVEWEHELYFRKKVESHWLNKWFPKWTFPPDKTTIKSSFLAFKEELRQSNQL